MLVTDTGVVVTGQTLNYESGNDVDFTIGFDVTDSGTPPITQRFNLVVHILDENDPPYILSDHIIFVSHHAVLPYLRMTLKVYVDGRKCSSWLRGPCYHSQ